MSSSRLCVKNLPKFLDEKGLKKNFTDQNFNVTDVKVLRTKDGRSRCVAFVGLANETEAAKAKAYFNKTFINMAKISVFFALPVGDERLKKKKNDLKKSKIVREVVDTKKASEKEKEFLKLFEPVQKDVKANFWDLEDETPKLEEQKSEPDDSNTQNQNEKPCNFNRVFVRNLNYTTTEQELELFFEKYGKIDEVTIIKDKTNASKGYGFITYSSKQHATIAQSRADGHSFQGRILHVLPALDNKNFKLDEVAETAGSSYQAEKAIADKQAAGHCANWNALFVRSDAVLNTLDGVDKLNLVNDTAAAEKSIKGVTVTDSGAVNLALIETSLIKQTKEFLENNGVSLSVLEHGIRNPASIERSKDTILVKNLPNDTDIPELRQLFSKFGEIARFLCPESKTMALVKFVNKINASEAFRRLAYKKYHRLPLFLEFAPSGSLVTPETQSKQPPLDPQPASIDEKDTSTSLFVKNINFDTDDDALTSHILKLSGQDEPNVLRKVSIKKHKNSLSRGYGFIECINSKIAKIVLRSINKSTLDGHELEVSKSVPMGGETAKNLDATSGLVKRSIQNNISGNVGVSSRKLMVRNIDFAATKKELQLLFENFGEIQSIRMPKKFGNSYRGFAFLTYVTAEDAQNAKSSLSATHFYGRKLVIEFAKEEEQTLQGLKRKAEHKETLIQKKKPPRID